MSYKEDHMRKMVGLYLSDDATELLQALAQELGIRNRTKEGAWSASGALEQILRTIRERGVDEVAEWFRIASPDETE